jgi:mono/diheme cytochrome c family protein
MPGFAGTLSDQDMADVVAYVEIVLQSGAGSDGD